MFILAWKQINFCDDGLKKSNRKNLFLKTFRWKRLEIDYSIANQMTTPNQHVIVAAQ